MMYPLCTIAFPCIMVASIIDVPYYVPHHTLPIIDALNYALLSCPIDFNHNFIYFRVLDSLGFLHLDFPRFYRFQ